jgi:hypothetical protein
LKNREGIAVNRRAGNQTLDLLLQRGKAAPISGVPLSEAISAKTSGISGLISWEH